MKQFVRLFLPCLIQTITGKPRYIPNVKFDSRIWIVNIFRLFEWIFGREFGIRPEVATVIKMEKGKATIEREFYTFEAFIANIEVIIRGFIFLVKSSFYIPNVGLNYQPIYLTFIFLGIIISFKTPQHLLPLFGLAIALDTTGASTAQTATPLTWNHTCTGSNLMLAIGVGLYSIGTSPVANTATYNSVSMTKAVNKLNTSPLEPIESSVWLLSNPTTGSNGISVACTLGTSPRLGGISVSYTGAKQTSTADATGNTSGITTGAKTFNVVTVLDNCWVFAVCINEGTSPTITATQTQRGSTALGGSPAVTLDAEDTNAPKTPAGTQSMGFTIGAGSEQGYSMCGASFGPAPVNIPNLIVLINQAVHRSYDY